MSATTMRRKDREVSREAAENTLRAASYGVLSLVDTEGLPYGVPLNFVYHHGEIYIHCAKEGKKLRSIDAHATASFCAVSKEEIVASDFACNYESAIAGGKVSRVEGSEKLEALKLLVAKYSPTFTHEGDAYIEAHAAATVVIKLTVEWLTGKRRDIPAK